MKKFNSRLFFVILLSCIFSLNLFAQQTNTLYFMDNVPSRNMLNPSFQPRYNFYLSLPVIGYSGFKVENNALVLRDLVYRFDPHQILFLNSDGKMNNFYGQLKNNTLVMADARVNILSLGFRANNNFWTISIQERNQSVFNLPKNLYKLGTTSLSSASAESYNLSSLSFNSSFFTEIALGYSRKVSDNINVGGRLKFLIGTANLSSSVDHFNIVHNSNEWLVDGSTILRGALPVKLNLTGDNSDFYDKNASFSDFLRPAGLGGALDMGVEWKLTEQLKVSAALLDLGFIHWTKTDQHKLSLKYNYKGITASEVNNDNIGEILDSISRSVNNAYRDSLIGNKAYNTSLSSRINLGAEYGFFNNKLSVGLLSSTLIYKSHSYQEFTASLNTKPYNWLNFSLSYSLLNGTGSNIGAGLGIKSGPLHWFFAADYIPVSGIKRCDFNQSSSYPVTSNTRGLNLSFGITIVLGNNDDSDRDGVVNKKDLCANTPWGVRVDKSGCPIDTDADGVPDYMDKCDATPAMAFQYIDSNGCPLDTDGDGVFDYLDKCPATPKEAYAHLNAVGCPLDTDSDGVFDYIDKCPNTVSVARDEIDSVGCLLDSDSDGVPDYLDQCPRTTTDTRKFVDSKGCVPDADSDGIPDFMDKCPNTPTLVAHKVDEYGCPLDSDKDGVPDYKDVCPDVPGVISANGCPELNKEIKALFAKAMQAIQFETAKYVIKPVSYSILDQITKILIDNPTFKVEIQGHTDNVGKPEANLKLSENRANAVRLYLLNKGILPSRMTSKGYGDTIPLKSNDTSAGRAKNRRVEFVVTFEATLSK